MDLYEESIQHEEELESEKQEEKQQDAHGKMAAIHIREAALVSILPVSLAEDPVLS